MARRQVAFGIDPGLASLGWGVVSRTGVAYEHVHNGTLHTCPSDGSDEHRAVKIARELAALVEAARPDVIALERWVFYANVPAQQAHALGLVIGAVLALLPPAAPLVLLRAVDTRTALGLGRSASKDDVSARSLSILRGPRGVSVHARDALALALVAALRAPAAATSTEIR